MTVKLLSWNVNGIRSFEEPMKKFLDELQCDIISIQETKITRDKLGEDIALIDGYTAYFSFSRRRSGYSGVATYAKTHITPFFATEGLCGVFAPLPGAHITDKARQVAEAAVLSLDGEWEAQQKKDVDSEGRAVITLHQFDVPDAPTPHFLALINVYCPRADPLRPDRAAYKLLFYAALRQRAARLHRAGASVIIVGDLNTAHTVLDHCDPDEDFALNPGREFFNDFFAKSTEEKSTEPRKEPRNTSVVIQDENFVNERSTLYGCEGVDTELITTQLYRSSFKMVDTFRHLHPTTRDAFTCWNTRVNARETNFGTRIDYILCNEDFMPFVTNSEVLQNIHGSDHCPVKMTAKINPHSSASLPEICAKNFKEFQGGQQKFISNYFQKTVQSNRDETHLSESVPPKNEGKLLNFLVKLDDERKVAQNNSTCSQSLGKRKAPFETAKKPKKANLMSYFSQTSKSREDLGSLSLYEEEMLFIKNNPDIYKQLQNSKDPHVNIQILNQLHSGSKISEDNPLRKNNSPCNTPLTNYCNTDSNSSDISTKNNSSFSFDKGHNNSCDSLFPSTEKDCLLSANINSNSSIKNSTCNFIEGSVNGDSSKVISENNSNSSKDGTDRPKKSLADGWFFLTKGKEEAPLCTGHGEPCALRVTKKKGNNFNRKFYACQRGVGRVGQKEAQCNFFKWA